MISGKVNQKEIFNVKTMSIHNRIYGTSELTSCQILLDMLGLLYFAMIDCHAWVDVAVVSDVIFSILCQNGITTSF